MSCDILYRAAEDGRVSNLDLRILTILARSRDFTPSRKQIAEWAQCAPSSVPRSARRLETLGYLVRNIRSGVGAAQPTEYHIVQDTRILPDTVSSGVRISSDTAPSAGAVSAKRTTSPRAVSGRIQPKIPPYENITLTPQELNPEPLESSGSRSRPLRPDEIVLAAVSSPYLDPHKSQGLVQSSKRITTWMRAGADLDADIIPTVRALCVRLNGHGRPINSWHYFDDAIREAVARRLAAEQPMEILSQKVDAHERNSTGDLFARSARHGERLCGTSQFLMQANGAR